MILFHAFNPSAVLRATGADAFEFLQGQFTNDLRVPVGGAAYGLWLNQKGKVLADSQILRILEKEFLLYSPSSPAAAITQRLEQYIIADEVFLEDQTTVTRGLSIWGGGSVAFIKEMVGEIPVPGRFLEARGLRAFGRWKKDSTGFEVLGASDALEELRAEMLAQGGVEVSDSEAELARIEADIPSIPIDLGPTDLPQEAGLEVSAISFTKGCYLGQEVMARLNSMGQVRRRLQRVRGTGPVPAAGSPLFQATKKVGEIRSVAPISDGFVALAMLSRMGLDENAGLAFDAAVDAQPRVALWTK